MLDARSIVAENGRASKGTEGESQLSKSTVQEFTGINSGMYCRNEVEGSNCFRLLPPRAGLDSKDADRHDGKGSDEYRDHRYHDKRYLKRDEQAAVIEAPSGKTTPLPRPQEHPGKISDIPCNGRNWESVFHGDQDCRLNERTRVSDFSQVGPGCPEGYDSPMQYRAPNDNPTKECQTEICMNCEFCTTEATAKPVQSHCHCGGIRCDCPKLGTKLLATLHECTDTCPTCSGEMVDEQLVEINDDRKLREEVDFEEIEEPGSSVEQPTKQKLSEGYCGVGDLMQSNMTLENETKYDHPKTEVVMMATSETSQSKEEAKEKCKECEDIKETKIVSLIVELERERSLVAELENSVTDMRRSITERDDLLCKLETSNREKEDIIDKLKKDHSALTVEIQLLNRDGPPPEDDLEELKYNNTCLQAELNKVRKLVETYEHCHRESLCRHYAETPEVCQRLEREEANVKALKKKGNSKDSDLKRLIASNKNSSEAGVIRKDSCLGREGIASLLRWYLFCVCVSGRHNFK